MTLVLVKEMATQADTDREAIRHCKSMALGLNVDHASTSCRVVFRQTTPGHGAVACDDVLCTIGIGTPEQAALNEALERCRKKSKAASRCAAISSMVWRDDKVSSKTDIDAAEANKSSTANVSNERHAVFGLVSGKTLLSGIPSCAGEPLAKGQPYCHNETRTPLGDRDQELVHAFQLRRYDILVNAELFDVTSLYNRPLLGTYAWAQAWVSKDGVVRRLRFQTGLVEANRITANLIQKLGKPSNEELLDWVDSRTGQLVQQSPRITWDGGNYRIFFDTRAPIDPDNPQGDRGSLEAYDMSLLQQIWEYQRTKKPQQRGM